MIQINRVNRESVIVEDATTVKEAVEYVIRNHISMKGADLRDTNLRNMYLCNVNLSDADFRRADLSNADLSGADLSGADLSGANLSWADLSGANLSGADLSEARLDYSCLPLWCGSLDMRIDKKIFCQLLYHVLRAGKSVKDEEVAAFLSDEKALALANKFHRVEECGKLKAINTTEEK